MSGERDQGSALRPRLVLVSGLAADERFLYRQKEHFPFLEVPKWLEWGRGESLPAYASRLAASVLDQTPQGLNRDHPIVIGGVSLGGMLAQEMAKHLPAKRVVMISSCRHPSGVSEFLHRIEMISRPLPLALLSAMRGLGRPLVGRGGTLPAGERDLIIDMAMSCPMSFMRHASRAIMRWEGFTETNVPIDHIHGDDDWVIPGSRLREPPASVIKGGGHVLNLSHPREVNAFVEQALHAAMNEDFPGGTA